MCAPSGSREDPDRVAVHPVEGPEDLQGSAGQGDIPVFVSLGHMDMDEHPLGVDVLDFEFGSLPDPESEGIDDLETGAVVGIPDPVEDGLDFISAEDRGKFLFLAGADELERSPFPFEGEGVEILDAAERDG